MLYAIPAIIGLVIKFIILYFASSSKKSQIFISLVILIIIHNIIELFSIYSILNKVNITLALKLYYICILGCLAGMCIYTTSVCIERWNKSVIKYSIIVLTITTSLIIFTPLVINGFKPLGTLVTADKGVLYPIFPITAIFSTIYSIGILIQSCLFNKSTEKKIRAAYVLISILPVLFIGFGVLLLINIGYEISAIAALPIGTTLLLLITLKAENNHAITDIQIYLPFSKERKISQHLIQVISDYSVSEKDYKKTVKEIEKALLEYSYEKSGYCKSTTARKLNVSRSTLYGMFDRLGVKK